MTATTIRFRQPTPRLAAPLIEEAWRRQHRRRRRLTASLLVVAGICTFSITLWARSGQAGTSCAATSNCSSSSASVASRLPNPCVLLTTPEVVQALGRKLANRIPQQSGGQRHCIWNTMALGTFTSVHAMLTFTIARSTEAQFRRAEKSARSKGAELVPVRGVGELAVWTPTSIQPSLVVWADGYDLTLWATRVLSPLKVETALAAQALKHL